ncbi:hypothetical protein AB0N17_13625 [Streptomyces sp. NPDC051133]|uniref:hypothetical protein n=1 Tax=Streptomyces sp. NPDC051133 TaxID=3155521 RepID=UPI003447AE36
MKAEHYAAMKEVVEAIPEADGPQSELVPDGYYARDNTPTWEVADALAQYGRHTGAYRPEH